MDILIYTLYLQICYLPILTWEFWTIFRLFFYIKKECLSTVVCSKLAKFSKGNNLKKKEEFVEKKSLPFSLAFLLVSCGCLCHFSLESSCLAVLGESKLSMEKEEESFSRSVIICCVSFLIHHQNHQSTSKNFVQVLDLWLFGVK